MTIATGIFIKNGEAWRLEKCIKATQKQTRPPDEIIVVNFGSTPKNSRDYKKICKEVKYIEIQENTETFHPSRIANICIKATKCQYIIFTDIDCVPSPNAYQLAEQVFQAGYFVMCRRIDLMRSEDPHPSIDRKLHKAQGSFQGMSVDWIKSKGGYDEGFRGWGFYDLHIEWMAVQDGIQWRWLDELGMRLYHYHHEPLPYRKETSKKNQNYFYKLIGKAK